MDILTLEEVGEESPTLWRWHDVAGNIPHTLYRWRGFSDLCLVPMDVRRQARGNAEEAGGAARGDETTGGKAFFGKFAEGSAGNASPLAEDSGADGKGERRRNPRARDV